MADWGYDIGIRYEGDTVAMYFEGRRFDMSDVTSAFVGRQHPSPHFMADLRKCLRAMPNSVEGVR